MPDIVVRVSGVCMAPLIRDGARVRVSGPARFYWPGDVVVVPVGDRRYALHRVIGCYRRRAEWKFVTRGDGAPRPDAAVWSHEIVGRVVGGECPEQAVQVPFGQRMRALWQFIGYAFGRGWRSSRA